MATPPRCGARSCSSSRYAAHCKTSLPEALTTRTFTHSSAAVHTSGRLAAQAECAPHLRPHPLAHPGSSSTAMKECLNTARRQEQAAAAVSTAVPAECMQAGCSALQERLRPSRRQQQVLSIQGQQQHALKLNDSCSRCVEGQAHRLQGLADAKTGEHVLPELLHDPSWRIGIVLGPQLPADHQHMALRCVLLRCCRRMPAARTCPS